MPPPPALAKRAPLVKAESNSAVASPAVAGSRLGKPVATAAAVPLNTFQFNPVPNNLNKQPLPKLGAPPVSKVPTTEPKVRTATPPDNQATVAVPGHVDAGSVDRPTSASALGRASLRNMDQALNDLKAKMVTQRTPPTTPPETSAATMTLTTSPKREVGNAAQEIIDRINQFDLNLDKVDLERGESTSSGIAPSPPPNAKGGTPVRLRLNATAMSGTSPPIVDIPPSPQRSETHNATATQEQARPQRATVSEAIGVGCGPDDVVPGERVITVKSSRPLGPPVREDETGAIVMETVIRTRRPDDGAYVPPKITTLSPSDVAARDERQRRQAPRASATTSDGASQAVEPSRPLSTTFLAALGRTGGKLLQPTRLYFDWLSERAAAQAQ